MESAQFNCGMLRAEFEPAEDMESHIRVIQGNLENQGYTNFKSKFDADSFDFQRDGSILNYIGFLEDRRNGFTLAPTSITFHTRDFGDYDFIVSALMAGLECIHNAVSISRITRLGFLNIRAVDSQEENIWKDYFSYSSVEKLGLKKQHAQFQQVFASDFESNSKKGSLTLNVHLENSCDDISTDLGVDEYSFIDQLVSTERETESQLGRVFSGVLVDHFVESSFSLENDEIDMFFYRLIQKTESFLEAVEQAIKRQMYFNQVISILESNVIQPEILSKTETESIPEHIEKIRNVLNTRTYDLVKLFAVSERTLFLWISGKSLPETKKRDSILQLSKICDQLTESNVKRPDILFRMKNFDGNTLMDIFQSGKVTDKHVKALIEEDRIMERDYQESGLPDRKSIPISDWKSYLSIPGTIENY